MCVCRVLSIEANLRGPFAVTTLCCFPSAARGLLSNLAVRRARERARAETEAVEPRLADGKHTPKVERMDSNGYVEWRNCCELGVCPYLLSLHHASPKEAA